MAFFCLYRSLSLSFFRCYATAHTQVTVITAMSSNLKVGPGEPLPERADVVVTETMGVDLLSELMYRLGVGRDATSLFSRYARTHAHTHTHTHAHTER